MATLISILSSDLFGTDRIGVVFLRFLSGRPAHESKMTSTVCGTAPSYYFSFMQMKRKKKKRIGAGYLFVAPCLNLLPGVGEFIYNVFFGLLTANKWLSNSVVKTGLTWPPDWVRKNLSIESLKKGEKERLVAD